jgi:hypothetical protein
MCNGATRDEKGEVGEVGMELTGEISRSLKSTGNAWKCILGAT